jgi:hypothetical protein
VEQFCFHFLLTAVRFKPELQFVFRDCNGKWMLPFVNTIVTLFALCLPYAKITSYSTRHVQISNDAKLNITDGAYKDF